MYTASEISLFLPVRSSHICKEKPINSTFEMLKCLDCPKKITNIVLNVHNACTVRGTNPVCPTQFLPSSKYRASVEDFTVTSPVFVCCHFLNNSLPTFLTAGETSFFHKLWPYWTAASMQRLLDVPWLPDYSTTAWMCDLACSEGAHHCQLWAGSSLG